MQAKELKIIETGVAFETFTEESAVHVAHFDTGAVPALAVAAERADVAFLSFFEDAARFKYFRGKRMN